MVPFIKELELGTGSWVVERLKVTLYVISIGPKIYVFVSTDVYTCSNKQFFVYLSIFNQILVQPGVSNSPPLQCLQFHSCPLIYVQVSTKTQSVTMALKHIASYIRCS